LVLGHGFAQVTHSFAQRFHGVGLSIYGLCQIIIAQGFFCSIHGIPRATDRFTRGITFRCALSGQILLLTLQFLTQGLLAIRKLSLKALPILTF
jgi:hypothetical protein